MTRTSILRSFSVLALAGLTAILAGCSSDNKIAFTNVSETALNVQFYVLDATMPDESTVKFVSNERMQVAPGQTVKYALTSNPNYQGNEETLVHMQVEPVTPSWDSDTKEYWLEMLTMPPVTIVATGTPDALSFDTGNGSVALIPASEMTKGRFDHTSMTMVEDEQPAK